MARSVPLSRSTLRVGGGSAFYVRRHSHFMKYHTPLITAALFASLLTGCSKHPPAPAAGQKVVDFGVVEVSSSGTNHFDFDLGSNQVCIVRSFIIKQPTGEQMVVSSAEIAMNLHDGKDHMLVSSNPQTNSLGHQIVVFDNGAVLMRLEPHLKP